ncbi:hypothetical protein GDO86_020387 [Hymenochirus boettgeri]|uniref:Uncharacterized protein n=1 Tax=Hymenochirus boettgeri TaxID=247094 RepID=A0A8T2IMF5_9PIPI|nr:hypothetical protein GDO86_020387 [Hymenochirus boettgeri]
MFIAQLSLEITCITLFNVLWLGIISDLCHITLQLIQNYRVKISFKKLAYTIIAQNIHHPSNECLAKANQLHTKFSMSLAKFSKYNSH